MQDGQDEGAGVRPAHAVPQRRPSSVHLGAPSLAGDLHTSDLTKKDAKEVRTLQLDPLCNAVALECISECHACYCEVL